MGLERVVQEPAVLAEQSWGLALGSQVPAEHPERASFQLTGRQRQEHHWGFLPSKVAGRNWVPGSGRDPASNKEVENGRRRQLTHVQAPVSTHTGICASAHIYTHTHTHENAQVYVQTHMHTHIPTPMSTHRCMCKHTCIHIPGYEHAQVYVQTHMHTHILIPMSTHRCMCKHTCAHTYPHPHK